MSKTKTNAKKLSLFEKTIDISDNPDAIIALMNQDWTDVHHSRNQDWLYWTILGAIIAGIMGIFSSNDIPVNNFKLMISMLLSAGILISFWAAAISWSHWLLHIRKIEHIKWLQSFFYVKNKDNKIFCISPSVLIPDSKIKKYDFFIVNGLIFSMYFTIGIFFIISLILSIIFHFDFKQLINNSGNLPMYLKFSVPLFCTTIVFIIHLIFKINVAKLRKDYQEKFEA